MSHEAELARRVTTLERELVQLRRELEADRRKTMSEVSSELGSAMKGVERHIEAVIGDAVRGEVQRAVTLELGPYAEKLRHFDAAVAVIAQIPQLLTSLNAANQMLARFEEREKAADKVEREESTGAEAKLKRWQAYAAVLGPIVALLAALLGAVLTSHAKK